MANNCISLSMVVALAKKFAIEYGALGIANVEAVPPNKIKFTLTGGQTYTVTLTFDASGVSFNNTGTTITASTVQDAIVELLTVIRTKPSIIWRTW